MNLNIDPYKILGVNPESSLEDVKNAYKKLAMVAHPDKGGNAEEFKILKSAFKMIIDSIKKGKPIQKQSSSTYAELKNSSQIQYDQPLQPHEFLGSEVTLNPNKNFNNDTFNQKFMQGKQKLQQDNASDYLIDVSEKDYKERTKQQFEREQAEIDSEIGKIEPIFDRGQSFNNNAFQKMFEHLNGTQESRNKALQNYEEPQALVASLQPYTEINQELKINQTNNLSSLGFSNYNDSFICQKNPEKIDRDLLQQFSNGPNITDARVIEEGYHNNVKKKMSEYQTTRYNFHPKPENPNQLPTELHSSSVSGEKSKTLGNNLQQKLQERNDIFKNMRYDYQIDQVPRIAPPPPQSPSIPALSSSSQSSRGQLNQQNDRYLTPTPMHHSIPIMDYPKNSNYPSQGANPNSSSNLMAPAPDYFAKIPHATQNANQMYQSQQASTMPLPPPIQIPLNMITQQGQQGQQGQQSQQYPQQFATFQNQSNPNNLAEIQKQITDLQKTVIQQNKLIKNLSAKKKS